MTNLETKGSQQQISATKPKEHNDFTKGQGPMRLQQRRRGRDVRGDNYYRKREVAATRYINTRERSQAVSPATQKIVHSLK